MSEVKKMRLINGYTQEFVAKELGIAQNVYSHKEGGRVKFTIKEAIKLAKFYSTTVEELFSDVI